MKNNLIAGNIRFEQVKGVGTIDISFSKDKNAYVLIGENGVGKTKFLESLFAILLLSNEQVFLKKPWIKSEKLPFNSVKINEKKFQYSKEEFSPSKEYFKNFITNPYPIVYLSASNRNNINEVERHVEKLGDTNTRHTEYLKYLTGCFDEYTNNDIKQVNMDINIEQWIIQRAQSANKYQAKEDNREIEITTLLKLLNKIDNRVDDSFLEISGDNRVFIMLEKNKRELCELSSGFTSILKILQGIIAGYSYFTNEVQIQNVSGFVLIDEIESHLHNEWQVKIVPLLKEIFPNTVFVVSTHSSLVISQLEEGEAYLLKREEDGIVYGKEIKNPNKISFIDLMNNAFNIDLNKIKINRTKAISQAKAKKSLLTLVEQELTKLGTK